MTIEYLDLGDFLVIAEEVLGVPAEDIAQTARLDLAESALHAPAAAFGDVEFHTRHPLHEISANMQVSEPHPPADSRPAPHPPIPSRGFAASTMISGELRVCPVDWWGVPTTRW